MDIGIGLPSNIPGAEAVQVVEWAGRAERLGFSSLGAIDRLVYDNYEPLITLAAAAAVTTRIRLATVVVIAPLHANTAMLAKQVASVNRLSGGRLVLGLAPGGRADDYEASRLAFDKRGRAFDLMITEMRDIWSGGRGIGPRSAAPQIIIGGFAPRSFERAARHGDGWIAGADGAEVFAQGAERARQAWRAAGREDRPRFQALCYFSLGPDPDHHAKKYLHDYYAFAGPFAEKIAAATLKDKETIRSTIEAYEKAGNDELILLPVNPDPEQVDLLAEAIG
ncbi:LLM class flavin-dependent oxidoreductase [Nonomuraea sp. NPDC003804]|uniref:LLM class flavin-dependent oxidoreductase n=1 Tax=Nonomuraea sp. NPDC003804 TaxID=3154547 RepID=UPI0033B8340A